MRERIKAIGSVLGEQLGKRLGRGKNDVHLGEPGFLKQVLRRERLESVFLFVTSRCNARCKTCFYVGENAKGEDLSLEQIRRISETGPAFDKLWLSGGEPFLREDLVEIIETFHRNNAVKSINLPTNGLLGGRVEEVIARLLDSCPELNILLNFSVDGLGETHDRVRGVPGNFQKVMASIARIEERFGRHPKLHVNIATVVTPDAYGEMFDLGLYLLKRFDKVATHFYETVRGDPRDPSVKRLGRADLELLHERLMPLYEVMGERLFGELPAAARWFAKMYFVGVIGFAYGLQERNVEKPHPWGMKCTAGTTTAVIDHNGAFRACEMRPRIGRLQDFDFDLSAALKSRAMRDEIDAIGGGFKAGCWCTHTCWVLASMQFSPRTLLLRIPWAYARYRLRRPASIDLRTASPTVSMAGAQGT
ncbi:MAG: radical SAM protein [Deltaproteobacteria bacterium]|nr:radical SAM protein [Deltaproteobacteria bacterium]